MRGTGLTKRQREALEIIRKSVRERGVATTHGELAEAMNIANPTAVGGHLAALARKRWIEVIPGVDRGIRLLREGAPILDSADLGTVATNGTAALEERECRRLNDFESLSGEFAARPDFFIRIDAESPDTAGFASGDLVAVREQADAQDGDIVLTRIGTEVTLKRLERIGADTAEPGPQIVGVVVGGIVQARRATD